MPISVNGIEARKAGSTDVSYILSAVGVFPIASTDISRSLGGEGVSTSDVSLFATRGGAGGLVTPFDIPPDGFSLDITLAPNSQGRVLLDKYIAATTAYAGANLIDTYLSLMVENRTTKMRTVYKMGGIATNQSGDPVTREDGQGNKTYSLRFCYKEPPMPM